MAEEAKRKENAKRRAEEAAEAKRKAEEAEAKRKAEEAEAKRKAEAEAERKAEAAKKTERKEFEAWTHNRDQLPCDKGKDGFMWSFEPANGGPLWRPLGLARQGSKAQGCIVLFQWLPLMPFQKFHWFFLDG